MRSSEAAGYRWLSRSSTEQAGASNANNSAAGWRAVIAHPFSTASFSPVNMVLHVVEARSASS